MKIESIQLAGETQLTAQKELTNIISDIEGKMMIVVDNKNGDQIASHLSDCINLLGTTPRLMELASIIHSHVLGIAASEIMDHPKLMESKQLVMSNFLKGRIAKWEGMYQRADRASKNLTTYIEGLRSLLSYIKSERTVNSYQQNL